MGQQLRIASAAMGIALSTATVACLEGPTRNDGIATSPRPCAEAAASPDEAPTDVVDAGAELLTPCSE